MRNAITAVGCSLLTIACTSCVFALLGVAQAQEQEVMAKPTKEHELLKYEVGTWDAIMTIWHEPGAEPISSEGVEKSEMLPGDMWLISKYEGSVVNFNFTGLGQMGYDPVEKKFIGTWIDSMTPFLMTMKGTYDADAKVLTSDAEGRDNVTKKPIKLKLISRFINEDTRVFEMHSPGDDGKLWKMMQIDYKRRQEP